MLYECRMSWQSAPCLDYLTITTQSYQRSGSHHVMSIKPQVDRCVNLINLSFLLMTSLDYPVGKCQNSIIEGVHGNVLIRQEHPLPLTSYCFRPLKLSRKFPTREFRQIVNIPMSTAKRTKRNRWWNGTNEDVNSG